MKIYNSLTRTKEEFEPIVKGEAGIYVCGPTVYDDPHIGHARSAYIFDVIRRYLEYKRFKVTFVRNVTDVDDKIIEKARKGLSAELHTPAALTQAVGEVSRKYLEAYREDMRLLGIREPDREPKATEYIPKMIKFIALLIERGAAYAAEGDVYFDIKKSKGYGKLSNQNLEKMEIGARISPGEKKKDPLDFALWKKSKEGEPFWDSPWGKGRPGWHIECSAMSSDILGDVFDIHGGGIDLIFPHHENEIAQSEGAGKAFARLWMHNGLLTINSEKMAKSLGNFISIKAFLSEYRDRDYLKLLFLNTHYRHPVDYNKDKIAEMKSQKERFLIFFGRIERMVGASKARLAIDEVPAADELKKKFDEAMDDDFNTPLALAALFDIVTYANKFIQKSTDIKDTEIRELAAIENLVLTLSSVLGLDLSAGVEDTAVPEQEILAMIRCRDQARSARDFKAADEIRRALLDKGVILEDTKDGTIWRKKI